MPSFHTPAQRRRPQPATARPLALLPAAQALLAIHQPDAAGLCTGCRQQWARVVPHPCTQHIWAQAVHDRIPSPDTLTALGLTAPTQPRT
jgi:hypothetical protein